MGETILVMESMECIVSLWLMLIVDWDLNINVIQISVYLLTIRLNILDGYWSRKYESILVKENSRSNSPVTTLTLQFADLVK